MREEIKWEIDHDCGQNSYLLCGDYNGHRFCRIVSKGYFGIPLMYAKWLIVRNYKIIYSHKNF